jgi:hypothetical protein
MDEARARYARDLIKARKEADAATEDVWLGRASMEDYIEQDRTLRRVDRLEGYRSRGQVPVAVDVFVFGIRWPFLPREVGRPAGSRRSRSVSR